MATQKYTYRMVAEACLTAHGNLSTAAKILRCSRQTVANYAKRYKTVQAAIKEGRASIVDLCENKSLVLINEKHWPTIKYWLTTQGRDRGFGPEGDENILVEVVVRYEDDPSSGDPQETA